MADKVKDKSVYKPGNEKVSDSHFFQYSRRCARQKVDEAPRRKDADGESIGEEGELGTRKMIRELK